MIALISIMAVVLAVMVVLTIICFALFVAVGIPGIVADRQNDGRWWLLVFVTGPAGCAILFWLMRMIVVYGGIA
jgi:hypothetical protein